MRRSRRLLIGLLLILLSVATFLVLDSSYFRVQEVTVSGNERVSKEEVIALTGLVTGAHFFSFRTGQVVGMVQQNPWIARAQVTRVVPGKVRITVKERVPTAAIPYHNGFVVVDDQGYVVEFVPVGKVTWPIITGWDPVETVAGDNLNSLQVSTGLRCVSQLTPSISAKLSEINVNQQGDVVVFLMGGLRVYIGQADAQVAKKLSTLESMLEDFAKNKMDVSYVDLRYDKPVVKLKTSTPRTGGAGGK